jgi:hypothetical protein
MKKIIRLTESDLTRIVKRVIKENEDDMILIPSEYRGVRMKLGEYANPQDIIKMYNELVKEGTTLVDYSEYGTEGMFYNEKGDEIPVDVVLGELNYAYHISKFTKEELEKISRMVINMSQPEFFEDYEARNYLYYEVANKDKELYDSLVKWIMDNKKDFDTRNLLSLKQYYEYKKNYKGRN